MAWAASVEVADAARRAPRLRCTGDRSGVGVLAKLVVPLNRADVLAATAGTPNTNIPNATETATPPTNPA